MNDHVKVQGSGYTLILSMHKRAEVRSTGPQGFLIWNQSTMHLHTRQSEPGSTWTLTDMTLWSMKATIITTKSKAQPAKLLFYLAAIPLNWVSLCVPGLCVTLIYKGKLCISVHIHIIRWSYSPREKSCIVAKFNWNMKTY